MGAWEMLPNAVRVLYVLERSYIGHHLQTIIIRFLLAIVKKKFILLRCFLTRVRNDDVTRNRAMIQSSGAR